MCEFAVSSCLRPRFVWFELVLMSRRLLLAIALSFLSFTSVFQFALIAVILIASLALQLVYVAGLVIGSPMFRLSPFASLMANRLETSSLIVISLTVSWQQAWRAALVQDGDTWTPGDLEVSWCVCCRC